MKKFQLETGKFPIRNKIMFQLEKGNIAMEKRKIFPILACKLRNGRKNDTKDK